MKTYHAENAEKQSQLAAMWSPSILCWMVRCSKRQGTEWVQITQTIKDNQKKGDRLRLTFYYTEENEPEGY